MFRLRGNGLEPAGGGQPPRLKVTSTLDGHTTVPHRIHWQALPSPHPLDVSKVAFVVRNNRQQIIEGGELKHLLAEHLHLDVRVDLARRPRRPG